MYTKRWIPGFVITAIGRSACNLLGWHGVTCRGRADHKSPVQCSWHPVLKRVGC